MVVRVLGVDPEHEMETTNWIELLQHTVSHRSEALETFRNEISTLQGELAACNRNLAKATGNLKINETFCLKFASVKTAAEQDIHHILSDLASVKAAATALVQDETLAHEKALQEAAQLKQKALDEATALKLKAAEKSISIKDKAADDARVAREKVLEQERVQREQASHDALHRRTVEAGQARRRCVPISRHVDNCFRSLHGRCVSCNTSNRLLH